LTGDRDLPTPGGLHDKDLYTSFSYPEKGALFTVELPPLEQGCICPYMRVVYFRYSVPTEYAPSEDLIPWHGFGAGYAK